MAGGALNNKNGMGADYTDDGGTGTIKIGQQYTEEKPQNEGGGCC